MKLLRYTYSKLALLFFILVTLWGILFYFTLMEQIMDETNDTLADYKAILIRKALREPEFMDEQHTIMWHYRFRKLTREEGENYRERYYDTTVYIETEDEYEPVRALKTCFRDGNGDYHELELMISTVERDDMVQAIVLYLVILYSLFFICTLWGTRMVLKRIFYPLTYLLEWLNKVVPGKPVPPLKNETPVEEFRKLNEAALSLSKRSEEAYQQQKEFIENASHELQTPLAIARGKIELLVEGENLTEEQLRSMDDIYRTLGRAVKLNKSLLLLTRIINRQYGEITQISLTAVVKDILPGLSDIYENRSLKITCREEGDLVISGNEDLAYVLITNLLKNAFIHTPEGGEIKVYMDIDTLRIGNSGEIALDMEYISGRFHHSTTTSQESTGLGLSIVQAICEAFHLRLSYSYTSEHCFELKKIN